MSLEKPMYDPTDTFGVKVWDLEWRSDAREAWLARIYQPCGNGPFPALLDVHGGTWTSQDRTLNTFLDQHLAASGLVVVAIDFRLAPQHPYPAQVADVNLATRWLKARAQEFNADPHCVGAIGTSSGGHTAILSAMQPHNPRYTSLSLPEAPSLDAKVGWVMVLCPVLDPYARYLYAQRTGKDDLVALTQGYFLTEDAMQEGNPQLLLDRGEDVELPPVLVIQGTVDTNIPLSIPHRFAASYRAAGGKLDLELFQDMSHFFSLWPRPEALRALEIMKAWVARHVAAQKSTV